MRKPLQIKGFRPVIVLLFTILCLFGTSHAEIPAEYLRLFDPSKGFKPAQRDLTEVFLQLAGSLEVYGSPEPYLRHVAAEHSRVETLYRKRSGREPRSFRPPEMTDAHIDRIAANWNHLSPILGLDTYAKELGHLMREAIKGTRGTGTIAVAIFNQHQSRVFDAVAGRKADSADYEALSKVLVRELELDKDVVDEGRYEVARRDAVRCAIIIHGLTTKLFAKIDSEFEKADAEKVKKALTRVLMETGEMAHSELEVGISEWALQKLSSSSN